MMGPQKLGVSEFSCKFVLNYTSPSGTGVRGVEQNPFLGSSRLCSGDYTISCSHVVQYNHNHKGSHFLANMQLIGLLLLQQCDICSEKCQGSLFQMLLDT